MKNDWLRAGMYTGALVLLLGWTGCLEGCAIFKQQAPIEHFADRFLTEAIAPAVQEGLKQGVENLTVQAGAQAINPTYHIAIDGKWVVGIEIDASVAAEGVAGQIQISSVSTEETETSPHATPMPPVTP